MLVDQTFQAHVTFIIFLLEQGDGYVGLIEQFQDDDFIMPNAKSKLDLNVQLVSFFTIMGKADFLRTRVE